MSIIDSLLGNEELEIPKIVDNRFANAVDRRVTKIKKVAKQTADMNRPEAGYELLQVILDQAMTYIKIALESEDQQKRQAAILIGIGLIAGARDSSEILLTEYCKKHLDLIGSIAKEKANGKK